MQQLSSPDIKTFHERLLSEQARLLRLPSSNLDVLTLAAGLSIEDQNPLLNDQLVALHSRSNERQKLQKIRAALERLRTGGFGICQECEEAIPRKRLLAIPWADHCVGCQEQLHEHTVRTSELQLAA